MKQLSIWTYYAAMGICLAFFAILQWGFIEDFVFFKIIPADGNITQRWCPFFMNAEETLEIQAPMVNPSDKPMQSIVYVEVTTGVSNVLNTERLLVHIPPHSTEMVTWTVTEADKLFDSLILMRVVQYNDLDLPVRSSFCNVLVLEAGNLSGQTILWGLIGLTSFALLLGVVFPYFTIGRTHGMPTQENVLYRQMVFAAAMTVFGIVLTFWSFWMPGFFIMIFVFFMLLAIFKEFVLLDKKMELMRELANG